MFDLASHIEYLLMSHDCVVAPGLGAFLVHETPAHYDGEHCMFMPPTRMIGFNEAVTINDGLLAESVARRERISLQNATARIEAEINSFRHQLAQGEPLAIGQLGEMRTEEDRLIFSPSDRSAASMRYSGLLPLNILTLSEIEQSAQGDVAEKNESTATILPLVLKIAASIIFIMVIGGIYLTTNQLMGGRTPDMALLDSGLIARISAIAPHEIEEPSLPLSREIELNIATPAEVEPSTPIESAHETPQAEMKISAESISDARYILVVGSFPSMSAAQKYVDGNPGLNIMEMDGRYRIYAASARTNSQAHAKADSLREEYPNVWICQL